MMNKTTNANRITLWTSIDLMLPCIKAKIRSELSSFTENKVTALMYAANFKHFEEITYKLSKVSVGQPIIAVASFTDTFNEENNSNTVKVIDSGNLGECFDMDFDLAEWYIDENGDLCSYNIDREGAGFYIFFTLKKDAPLSLVQRFFKEAESGDCGFLSNRSELAKFCRSGRVFAYETGRDYGVRVNTQDYAYLMRLNPYKGEYNLYCYCYKKDWLDSHLEKAERGIRFINSDYKEIFRIEDGDKIRITYSDGEKADKICRYVDDYHIEADSDIFHICEFAERLEKARADVIPLRSSLPDQCYVFVQSENKIGIVNKGEKGYIDSKSANGKPSENRALVDDLNGKLGITKAQAEAMKVGSLLGWDCPAADPKNYNEKGTPIKPKNRNHERYGGAEQWQESLTLSHSCMKIPRKRLCHPINGRNF